MKNRFVISLMHKKLNGNQLLALCEMECSFECFFELASLYYAKSQYSTDTFSQFLFSFKKGRFSKMYDDLLGELLGRYTASNEEKYSIVKAEVEKSVNEKRTPFDVTTE